MRRPVVLLSFAIVLLLIGVGTGLVGCSKSEPSERSEPSPSSRSSEPSGFWVFADVAVAEQSGPWTFTDVTEASGLKYEHGYRSGAPITEQMIMCGGVASGDYDGDDLIDLYVVRGEMGPNLLFRNLGDGTFEEVGAAAGVAIDGPHSCGPTFADFDGDGWLDLIVGGLEGTELHMLLNRGDGSFEDITDSAGVSSTRNTFASALGDLDRDGDLDLFLTHWGSDFDEDVLWRNDGDRTFTNVDKPAGVGKSVFGAFDSTLTPNFADVNGDGWPDIVVASDFQTSRILLNNQDGTFTNITTDVISDENGMGSTLADYDNDGDLDWFVTSIWDPFPGRAGWGETGNRLYRNRGDGTFDDVTDEAGVREGYWGWAACFADFNNDGHLDIFHVNGMYPHSDAPAPEKFETWQDDPARLFVAQGDGTFTERSAELGMDDRGQGRGVVCFDYDRDGDVDIFIANNQEPPKLYRNDGGNAANFLIVTLRGASPNSQAIGARVYVSAGGLTQMRELRAGSNYSSQDSVEAHFGLGAADVVDEVRILWPSGESVSRERVQVNQQVLVSE